LKSPPFLTGGWGDFRGEDSLVHHIGGEREYMCDKHTEKMMPLAQKTGWTIIDMKNDSKMIFANRK